MTQVAAKNSATVDRRLLSKSFLALLVTQFLGAMNDNMFRWLAVPVAKPLLGDAAALSLGLACFTVPYLLLASWAGYLADRYSKRTVIVGCKLAEVLIMVCGVAAMLAGNIYLLFLVVALMGCQSALFSPSKFGSIPEILSSDKISQGNGWMGLVTVVASALGFIAGNWLYSVTVPDLREPVPLAALRPAAFALIGAAALGWLSSLFIRRLPSADPARSLPPNPLSETWHALELLGRNVPLLRTALGIAFFWFLAALAQMNIDTYGINELDLPQKQIGFLLGILVLGLGLGSVLAGIWSGGRVELGIVPLGAAGIAVSAFFLYMAGNSIDPFVDGSARQAHFWSAFWLFGLGLGAGLFNIPLEAFLQHRSETETRGTILAASNFISFSLILAASGLFFLFNGVLNMSASEIFLVAALGTVPVVVYVVSLLPQATIRFIVWLASVMVYRVRVAGIKNLPERGGALLVANHVSWLDGILLLLVSSRPIRMVAFDVYVESRSVRWITRLFGVIPIGISEGPKAIIRSLERARQAILDGELVCIFAEGQISRTGQLQPFQRGLLRIVKGTGAPVVPVYLDELWGSIFSFSESRFFWKWPRRWRYPVSINFGKPLSDPDNVNQVREAVQLLGVESVQARKEREQPLARRMIKQLKKSRFRSKVADTSGQELTGGQLLTRMLVFRRLLSRAILAADERMVGILLPPAAGAVVANGGVSLLGRVAVNLNYTLPAADVNYCLSQCGIKHVLTSRRFLEQRPFNLEAEMVCLEDFAGQVTFIDKLISLLQAYLIPAALLARMLGLHRIAADDLMTVIFTSGSTGDPKGVMLTHHNVVTNVDAANQLFHFRKTDVLLGVLPFFHSFGFTFTMWLTVCLDPKCVYHFNPGEARQIGKLCEKYGVTILAATPTFLKKYLKRCRKEQFHALEVAIVGAEKLPLDLAEAFEKEFGIVPTEGYGTTELSPLAACNVPDSRYHGDARLGRRAGTVGRAIPNVCVKVVDPDTGEDLGTNREGILLVSGPNVMKGYLNQPEKTAEVIRDGWYNTGDFAKIDDDGFIEITGRQSRFSKIGGEMVPHIRVEELLSRIVEDPDDDEGEIKVAVTSVPDEQKGERLVVLHRPLSKPVNAIISELSSNGLPNLWIPSADCFIQVDEIPTLGSGKLDLKRLKEQALESVLG